jgi:transposase
LGDPPALVLVYEAGPCGYSWVRELRAQGYRCEVVAPSKIPRKLGERIKTDRRDALNLASLARAGQLTMVCVPDARDEAVRDLCRARVDAVRARLKARQQLKAMLLRHGRRYTGKTSWSAAHERYLATIGFEHAAQDIAFAEYRQAVSAADARVQRLTEALIGEIERWRMYPVVQTVMTLRGLDVVAATTVVAELGDLRRFAHPRELMTYLGLVPSEHTTGSRRRLGAITKAGNGPVRRMLVEPQAGRPMSIQLACRSCTRCAWCAANCRPSTSFPPCSGKNFMKACSRRSWKSGWRRAAGASVHAASSER